MRGGGEGYAMGGRNVGNGADALKVVNLVQRLVALRPTVDASG